ncbi:MAG: hypothetical protein H6641_22385 [Caldilineaceae bacterium]|nr:hypothetical protein [Caldilineaceae bacterium]
MIQIRRGRSGLLALRLWLEEMGHPLRVVNNNLWDAAPATPESARREVVDAAAIELLFVVSPMPRPIPKMKRSSSSAGSAMGARWYSLGPDARMGR